jgi:hypothetical protein
VSYSLGNVKPWVRDAANELGPKFGISSIGGYRSSGSRDPNGHPAGLAIDLMVSDVKRGTGLAEYAKANAGRLGVLYIIWRQRIWSVARSSEGWRQMEDRGSPTQNHMDHVHISFNATAPHGGAQPVNAGTPTWDPNSKRVGGKVVGGTGGQQSGVTLPGVTGIRNLAITGAALLGGVALIALGAAATIQRGVSKSGPDKDDLLAAASFLPQGRAAAAAAGAAKTKGKP